MPMSEEIMETVETEVSELENTPVEEGTTEEVDNVEDYSQADQDFLSRFEVQFDKNPKKFETIDELKQAAEMGSALPRYKEKLAKAEERIAQYEKNSAYKYIDDFMKESGYKDPEQFVMDIKVNTKAEELEAKGMSKEDAKELAKQLVQSQKPSVDKSVKEIEDFLGWHNDRVDRGIFKDRIDKENIPEEVLDSYRDGMSLKDAFTDYYLSTTQKQTEQETLKKIQKNKETSAGEITEGTQDKPKTMSIAQIDKVLSQMTSTQQSKWADENWDLLERSGYFKR